MVVPVDENEIGYREVPETPGNLDIYYVLNYLIF